MLVKQRCLTNVPRVCARGAGTPVVNRLIPTLGDYYWNGLRGGKYRKPYKGGWALGELSFKDEGKAI